MTPGRELDILVAEKVMGWKRVNYEQLFPSQAGRKELSMYWYDSNDKELDDELRVRQRNKMVKLDLDQAKEEYEDLLAQYNSSDVL